MKKNPTLHLSPPPPTITVLMSVYNGEKFLKEAIDSILSQTFRDFEFLIINDGSTDGTTKILQGYHDPRITVIENKTNIGLTKSLNKGLREARGEYIARQDADDISLPERLFTQVSYLNIHQNIGLLGSAYHVINTQNQRVATYSPPCTDSAIRWQMLFHNAFCHTSVMFRRALLKIRSPLYNESFVYCQDYELWEELLAYTCGANLVTPLVIFRAHNTSISGRNLSQQQRIATIIATAHIKQLVSCELTKQQVNILRHWYNKFPRQLTAKDITLCQVLLKMLHTWKSSQCDNRNEIYAIYHSWLCALLHSVSLKHWQKRVTWDVLILVFRYNPLWTVYYIIKQIRHSVNRWLNNV